MPEGDSVYRLARRLTAQVAGRGIVDGELRSGPAAGASLAGFVLERFETHGKHLLTHLGDEWMLHTHLRMQGSWSVTAAGRSIPVSVQPTVRVRARLDDGRTMWGLDMPVVELARGRDAVGFTSHLGPDPLRDDWSRDEAVRRLQQRGDRPFVAALLDQRNLAGLGNLWVNELAFLSGTHPFGRLDAVSIPALVDRAHRALRLSATVPGMYQVTTGDRRPGRSHWVAGRAGKPCLRCGTAIRVRAEVNGDPERRRTWWCPSCQPMPPAAAASADDRDTGRLRPDDGGERRSS